jgi:hypothetical protein
MLPPQPSSSVGARSSFFALEPHCGSLLAPSVDALPACAPLPEPFPLQTHIPVESARISPPWFSSPTPLRSSFHSIRLRSSLCPRWAKLNCRSGPLQNAKITLSLFWPTNRALARRKQSLMANEEHLKISEGITAPTFFGGGAFPQFPPQPNFGNSHTPQTSGPPLTCVRPSRVRRSTFPSKNPTSKST